MSDAKLTLFVLFVGLTLIATVATVIFVAMPKATVADAWARSEVMSFKYEINRCNDDGGSAYITSTDRVLCERASR